MEPTRTSETTKISREILKRVDQLVKSNNLESALQEVRKARELDPKNLYTFAYEERIQELFNQRKKQAASDYKPINNTTEQIAGRSSDKYGLKVPTLYEEFKKAGLRPADKPLQTQERKATKEALETYKQALLLAWSDGLKDEDEIRELEDLRQTLSISKKEHEQLDRQAKLECYIFLLKHLMRSSVSKSEIQLTLAELRRSFDVSVSEHEAIQANLTANKERGRKTVIAVVEDDPRMLILLREILIHASYEVVEFNTSDSAYEFLQREKTDLILCDINLENSTMNGFFFYEKIREIRHLHQVPFIFITGLNDDVLMRAGKEMGVDDFIVKPFRPDVLLSTIRGRIKRYEQMRTLTEL